MIGQIGIASGATKFLESLSNNQEIAPVTFVTSGRAAALILAPI